MFQILLADDEPLAREELTRILSKQGKHFTVMAAVNSGKTAIEWLKNHHADVIFLDMEMPGLNGLETASRLAEMDRPPLVIFATAYDRYAVEAFEKHAVDYVLKPFDPERIEKALQHVRTILDSNPSAEKNKKRLKLLEPDMANAGRLRKFTGFKKGSRDCIVLDPGEISYFCAENEKVTAFAGTQQFIVNSTLKEIIERFPEFVQTHKSYAVNAHKIAKVAPMFSGNYVLHLKDPSAPEVPLSRRYVEAFRSVFGNL